MKKQIILATLILTVTLPVHADAQSDWLKARQAAFTTWQAAHPDVEAQIADLKVKTAALVAAYVPPPVAAKYADLKVQSAALGPAQRTQALQLFSTAFKLYQSGDFASAREGFDQGLTIDPANGSANYYRGDIYLRDGDKANAALYMDRATTLAPGTAEALKASSALRDLDDPALNKPPVIWRVAGAPTEIWDSPEAPQMEVIPAGEYTIGSPETEIARAQWEGPRHRVKIAYPFAVGKFDVTRGEFAQFVAYTKYDAKSGGCMVYGKSFNMSSRANWENPSFSQTDNDPVVCINWNDATAYANWLSQKTGHTYRLLSESEWEYATRAGTTTAHYWGGELGKGNANCNGCGSQWDNKQPSPSGSFAPNAFGLYDMIGNVWQWTGDCENESYAGAPADGSFRATGDCSDRVHRGGSWAGIAAHARSAGRENDGATLRASDFGFRVARTL